MKWRKENEHLAVSDQGYKVAKYTEGRFHQYRASLKGEFLGQITDQPKDAQAICDRHFQIMGKA